MRFFLSFPELHRGRSSILPRLGQTWPTPGTLRDLIDFYQLLLTSLGAICCETAFTPLTRHMDHMGAELNPGPMWGDWKLPLRQAELFRKGWMFYEPLFFLSQSNFSLRSHKQGDRTGVCSGSVHVSKLPKGQFNSCCCR